MSKSKDKLDRQTCKGILCVSASSPHEWRRWQDDPAREIKMGFRSITLTIRTRQHRSTRLKPHTAAD